VTRKGAKRRPSGKLAPKIMAKMLVNMQVYGII
jgi:hypothetical protein